MQLIMNEQVKRNKRVISQKCAMMIANIVKNILCLSKLQLSKFGTFYLDIYFVKTFQYTV